MIGRMTAAFVLGLILAGCGSGAGANTASAGLPATASPTTASPSAVSARLVRVAAASDLRFAMDELVAEWKASEPGVRVEPSYGSSGNFLAQIQAGAPFDVFFSADAAYPRKLEAAGLAAPGSTRIYATGQIVIWVPASSPHDIETRGLEALTDPAVRTVAIANPEHAPYGQAAVAAMKRAGVYDAVQPKLVLGENVSQAAQFVESGNADAGVIALSLAIAPTLKDKGRYAVVPIESYPRLEQGAVVLASAVDPVASRSFLDFVLGPGRDVLDRYGFLLPPP